MKSRLVILFVIALLLLVPSLAIPMIKAGNPEHPEDDSVYVYNIISVIDKGAPAHDIEVKVEVQFCPACNPNPANFPGCPGTMDSFVCWPLGGCTLGYPDGRYVAVRLKVGVVVVAGPQKIVCNPGNCPLFPAPPTVLTFTFTGTGLHGCQDVTAESDVYCSWCGHWYPTPETIHIVPTYELIVTTDPPSIDTPTGSGFYYECTYVPISCDPFVDIIPGQSRYRFVIWVTNDMSEITDPFSPSTTVHMDKDKTVTALYIVQYYLTVKTDPAGIIPAPTPPSGWYDECTFVTLKAALFGQDGTGTHYILHRWVICGQYIYKTSFTIHMDSPKTAVAQYCEHEYVDPIGDVDLDGQVDMTDLARVARHYGAQKGEANYDSPSDINGDGRIDLKDLATVARHLGA